MNPFAPRPTRLMRCAVAKKPDIKRRFAHTAKPQHDWLAIDRAEDEIVKALAVHRGVAGTILFGLIATGNVHAADGKRREIDLDETTIVELEGRPVYVAERGFREWLREHSTLPQTGQRELAIRNKLNNGGAWPGKTIPWKEFCNAIRDECNGWLAKPPSVGQRGVLATSRSNAT